MIIIITIILMISIFSFDCLYTQSIGFEYSDQSLDL